MPFLLRCLLCLSLCIVQLAFSQESLRIALLSDFNGAYGALDYEADVAKALDVIIQQWQPDLLLSAGDVIAGQSHNLSDERFGQMWQTFDQQIALLLREAGIPYAFAMGNHDASSLRSATGYSYARERQAARDYWQRHANLSYHSSEMFPFNYSFSLGDVFIVMIDASSAQLEAGTWSWLESELASDAAQQASWRFVVGHLPLYGVAASKLQAGEVLAEPERLRQLLSDYRVSIYISGHHAAYYPAKVGNLTLLHTGGIGGRQLAGSELAGQPSIVLMEVSPQGINLWGYSLRTNSYIALEDLPPRIQGVGGISLRIDQ